MTEAAVVRSYTGPEIAIMTAERPAWLCCPWVARGAITEISGKVKSAGKTTLIAHMSAAVIEGRPFLGRPADQSPVVMVTEQSPDSLRQSLRGTGLLELDGFHAFFLADLREAQYPWDEMVARAVEEAAMYGAGMMVFDTLMQVAGVRDESDPSEAVRVMEPLQVAVAAGTLGVVVSRHDRKTGGDVGDSSRGSSAYAGAVDIVLQVSRIRGGETNARIVRGLSRYEETPDRIGVELTDAGYLVLDVDDDDEPASDRGGSENMILMTLSRELATVEEIVARSEQSSSTVHRILARLVAGGRAARSGTGLKGDPYRYGFASHDEGGVWEAKVGSNGEAHDTVVVCPECGVDLSGSAYHAHAERVYRGGQLGIEGAQA